MNLCEKLVKEPPIWRPKTIGLSKGPLLKYFRMVKNKFNSPLIKRRSFGSRFTKEVEANPQKTFNFLCSWAIIVFFFFLLRFPVFMAILPIITKRYYEGKFSHSGSLKLFLKKLSKDKLNLLIWKGIPECRLY